MNSHLKSAISNEVSWSFSKSSGPGGQHVNTTDSKARLNWDFGASSALNAKQKSLITKKLNNYIKKNSNLQLTSSSHRKKELNQKDCLQKLFYLLENKAFKIVQKRLKTKPSRAAREKRVKEKKKRSEVKKNRAKVSF